MIKGMFEGKFIGSLAYTRIERLFTFSTPAHQSSLKLIHAGWFNKNRQGGFGELLLHMNGSFYINVKNRYPATFPDALELGLQGSVILAFVHHLPLNKFFVLYLIGKLFLADKIIIDTIFFDTPGLPRRSRNRKLKFIGKGRQEVPRDTGFAGAGRCCNDDDLLQVIYRHTCVLR